MTVHHHHRLSGSQPLRARLAAFVLGALVVSAASVQAQAGGDSAQQVVQLRREVDDLAQQLSDRRRAVRDELAGLRAERAELKRQLRLEQVRAKAFAQLEAEQAEKAASSADDSRASLQPARRAIDAARAYVDQALPFKVPERLARLDRIASELGGTSPDVGRAMVRLWRFIEEEQAMASEVALGQQPIQLGGKRRLVDVVRVGMALLYVRTPDGQFAWAVPGEDGWAFAPLEDATSIQLVQSLFGAMERNQRLGLARLLVPAGVGDRQGGS